MGPVSQSFDDQYCSSPLVMTKDCCVVPTLKVHEVPLVFAIVNDSCGSCPATYALVSIFATTETTAGSQGAPSTAAGVAAADGPASAESEAPGEGAEPGVPLEPGRAKISAMTAMTATKPSRRRRRRRQ